MSLWNSVPLPLKVIVPGIVAVIAVATLKPAPVPMPAAEPALPEVEVVYAEPARHMLKVHSQGTVAPKREIDLVAQVAGEVVKVEPNFVDGGFFSENSLLIQIDDRDYQFALQRAEARVRDAEQLLATERGRARQAKREWRDLGNSEANNLFLRKPQLAAAEAALASAKADLNKAELDLERTRIEVPFDGRVRATYVDLGQYVSPGTRIATVYDTATAEIRLPLTDRQAALVDLPLGFSASADNPGPAVKITGIVGTKEYVWQGRIARTDASIDTKSRMYYAVAEVNDPFVKPAGSAASGDSARAVPLIVGLFVEAEIDGRVLDDVIELPRDAVFQRDKIYRLERSGDAQPRVVEQRVQVLHKDAEHIWVRADLPAGTEVVASRQNYVSPGVAVVPVREASVPSDGLLSEPQLVEGERAGATQ